ncbi:MAG: hypothetical protein ABI383_05465 [Acidobacteriaceae bacterium]
MTMKVYFSIALLLFVATLAKIVTSAKTYCTDRWIAAAFLLIALVLAAVMVRRHAKAMGEIGALTLVILLAAMVFNGAFIFMATRKCHATSGSLLRTRRPSQSRDMRARPSR